MCQVKFKLLFALLLISGVDSAGLPALYSEELQADDAIRQVFSECEGLNYFTPISYRIKIAPEKTFYWAKAHSLPEVGRKPLLFNFFTSGAQCELMSINAYSLLMLDASLPEVTRLSNGQTGGELAEV